MWNTPTLHEIQYDLHRAELERRLARRHLKPSPRPGDLRRRLAWRLVNWGARLDAEAVVATLPGARPAGPPAQPEQTFRRRVPAPDWWRAGC